MSFMRDRLGRRLDSFEVARRNEKTFDAADYGVISGSGDARPGVLAAIQAATGYITSTSRPATVLLPSGVLSFTTGVSIPATATDSSFSSCGVPLPVGLPARLTVRGAGRDETTIKLSDACRNAFWINKTADYQIFRNVDLSDFEVDNNSSAGQCHVIVGNLPAAKGRQIRLNYADLNFRRLRARNIPVDITENTTMKFGIALLGAHLNAGQDGTQATQLTMEATQTSSLRVTIEDVDVYGGSGAVQVTSWLRTASYGQAGPTNHYYDQIRFRRCRHFGTAPTPTFLQQTSFFLCGAGVGNYGEIIDCYSENVGDDAIEVGAMQTLVIDRFGAVNPYLYGILWRVSQPPLSVGAQRCIVRDSTVKIDAGLASSTFAHGSPVQVVVDNGVTAGALEVDGLAFDLSGLAYSVMQQQHLVFKTDANVRRTKLHNVRVRIGSFTYDQPTSTDVDLFYIAPTVDGTVVDIRELDVTIDGFNQTGAGGIQFHIVRVDGTRPRVSIDGMHSDLSGFVGNSAGGSTSLLTVARGAGGTIRVLARRLLPRASASAGALSKNGVRLYGTGGVDQLLVEDSNFGPQSGLTADIETASATSANAAALILRGNVYLATQTKTTLAPSASPYTYTNRSGRQQTVAVIGGTVSKIEWGDTNFGFTDLVITSGVVTLAIGQSVRVTYTVIPTMHAMPVGG